MTNLPLRFVGIQLEDEGCAQQLRVLFQADGIAILPTDTLYGICGAMSSERAHRRVLDIKGYPGDRPFVYVASSVAMVASYIDSWGCTTESEMSRVWPAELTAIFTAGEMCPAWVGRTVALRVPRHPGLVGIIEAVGEPLFATSVNAADEAPLVDYRAIVERFGAMADVTVEGTIAKKAAPSTLIDFTGGKPKVLREGAYAWAAVGGEKPSN